MRTFGFLVGLAILTIGCGQISDSDKNTTVLKGATLFDGNGNELQNSILIIKDGLINYVGTDSGEIPRGAKVIDLKGKFITPGIVDAHIHFFQTAFFDSRPDAFDIRDSIPYEEVYSHQKANASNYFESYLKSGVTAVYDVGDFEWVLNMAKEAENDSLSPHIACSGPLLTPVPEDFIATFNTTGEKVMIHLGDEQTGIDHVKNATAKGATGIKIWSVAVNDTTFMKSLTATAQAVEEEDNQLIVHATSLNQAKAALKLGAKLLVHSVSDTIVDAEFLELAKNNGAYYNPTLVVGKGYYNTYKATMGDGFEIKDPNNAVDERTKTLLKGAAAFKQFHADTIQMRKAFSIYENRLKTEEEIMFKNLKKVYEAGIPIVVGTDAGNPGTLHGISIYDEMEAMQDAGMPAKDLIVMATKNGANIMRRGADFGTLDQGKFADLIILENNPSDDIRNMRSITHVMKDGFLRPINSNASTK